MRIPNALGMSREYAAKFLKPGDMAVDATAGRGRDTLLLSDLVKEKGRVWAFDIQEEAIEATRELLDEEGRYDNVVLINEGHERMDEYVKGGVSCVMFNLGYMPGGNHSIHTMPQTSIEAIEKAGKLLVPDGIILIVVYHGGDTGFHERDEVLAYCGTLDQNDFTVAVTKFTNQRGNPPILICIQKT